MAVVLRRSYITRDEIDRLPAMPMQCHRRDTLYTLYIGASGQRTRLNLRAGTNDLLLGNYALSRGTVRHSTCTSRNSRFTRNGRDMPQATFAQETPFKFVNPHPHSSDSELTASRSSDLRSLHPQCVQYLRLSSISRSHRIRMTGFSHLLTTRSTRLGHNTHDSTWEPDSLAVSHNTVYITVSL
jgi:hypothetical protein